MIDFVYMSNLEKTNLVSKSINWLFQKNRFSNFISFSFGYLIAHCTDFECLRESIRSIFTTIVSIIF